MICESSGVGEVEGEVEVLDVSRDQCPQQSQEAENL